MAKISELPIIVKNLETGKNYLVYTDSPPPEFFYSNSTDIRNQLEIDPWMNLLQEFSNQLHSNGITVGEFIEKMKENFNLEYKQQ
jgi:hypothetical protein